jgi:hypothetical protein
MLDMSVFGIAFFSCTDFQSAVSKLEARFSLVYLNIIRKAGAFLLAMTKRDALVGGICNPNFLYS